MKTDVTTQSIQEKVKIHVIPLVFIFAGLTLFGGLTFVFFSKLQSVQVTPVVTFVAPTPAENSILTGSVTIKFQVTGLEPGQRVRVWTNSLDNRNSCSLLYPGLELPITDGTPDPIMNTVRMANGAATVCAFVTGSSDNTVVPGSFTSRHFTINNPADTTPPVIFTFSPSPILNPPIGPAVQPLHAGAFDLGGIHAIQWLEYSPDLSPGFIPFTPIPNCLYVVTPCQTQWSFPDGLSTFIVRAIDMHGNYTDSVPVTVNVDAIPPTARWTNPNVHPYYISGIFPLRVDPSDNHGISSVTIRRQDNNQIIGADSTSPYEFPWNTLGLANGLYTLEAYVIDVGFNQVIEKIEVYVDNTPPTISWTAPSDGTTVSGSVSLSASGTDSDYANLKVEFFLDDVLIGKSLRSFSPFPLTWNTVGFANGSHTLKVVATNVAGLTASASRTVTISNSGGGGGIDPIVTE